MQKMQLPRASKGYCTYSGKGAHSISNVEIKIRENISIVLQIIVLVLIVLKCSGQTGDYLYWTKFVWQSIEC